jgi:hypothetical protein
MSDQPPYYQSSPEWQNNQQPSYGQYEPENASQPHTYDQPPYSQQPLYSQEPFAAQPLPYGQQGYAPPSAYGAPPYEVPIRAPDNTRFAILGLVLGIIAILSSWYPICGLPLPILGIVISALGRRSLSIGPMATVGLVLSIIALVIGFIISALVIIAAVLHSS